MNYYKMNSWNGEYYLKKKIHVTRRIEILSFIKIKYKLDKNGIKKTIYQK